MERDANARFPSVVELARALAPFGARLSAISLHSIESELSSGRLSIPQRAAPNADMTLAGAAWNQSSKSETSRKRVAFAVGGALFGLLALGGWSLLRTKAPTTNETESPVAQGTKAVSALPAEPQPSTAVSSAEPPRVEPAPDAGPTDPALLGSAPAAKATAQPTSGPASTRSGTRPVKKRRLLNDRE
jgi:hypothetical protein